MSVADRISTIVSIVVGLMAIGAVIVRAIYADARQKAAIEELTEAVKELTGRVLRMEERQWNSAVRSQKRRGQLPSGQQGNRGRQGDP